MIPPEHHGDCGASMEDRLDLSQRPSAPRDPLVNRDAKPVQWMQETRTPLAAQPGKPLRDDYASARVATANVLLCTEPLTGWRTLALSAHRTAGDWAHQLKHLLDACSPEADKVLVVCDNLKPQKGASLYEAFAPPEARRRARRLAIHYTPKQGSGWNIAEIALSVLTKPGLERRIPAIETWRQATTAWEHERNATQTGVDWQCTTADARIRLKRLYPQYQN